MSRLTTRKRRDILNALRQGTVPEAGLDALAVGLERFIPTLNEELQHVASGSAQFKCVRGEYGSGKTFFTRHFAEQAMSRGFATTEVQISETETPLHKLETVYRKITESLRTSTHQPSAFRDIIDAWFFHLEEQAIAADPTLENASTEALSAAVGSQLEQRLAGVSANTPAFAQALRGYRAAMDAGDHATADALVAWMGGQPHVAAGAKRDAGIRGNLDHFGAMGFLQGLLAVLRDGGRPGLILVLDEVETLQRMRSDVRDKALNALRQLTDEVTQGRYPGLYVMMTGTAAFFDGPNGVQRLAPLASRLATDFGTDARFDNPRSVQLRLSGFDETLLVKLGLRVRDMYAEHSGAADRILTKVDDAYVADFARAVVGTLNVGIAPRLYLKKLVGDVLDRVDQFEDFDPRVDYAFMVSTSELDLVERAALQPDDIDLDLS